MLGFSGALFNGISTALIVPVILKIVGQEVDLSTAPPILKAMMSPFDNTPEAYRVGVMAGHYIHNLFKEFSYLCQRFNIQFFNPKVDIRYARNWVKAITRN